MSRRLSVFKQLSNGISPTTPAATDTPDNSVVIRSLEYLTKHYLDGDGDDPLTPNVKKRLCYEATAAAQATAATAAAQATAAAAAAQATAAAAAAHSTAAAAADQDSDSDSSYDDFYDLFPESKCISSKNSKNATKP